jgi:hypothetical protein
MDGSARLRAVPRPCTGSVSGWQRWAKSATVIDFCAPDAIPEAFCDAPQRAPGGVASEGSVSSQVHRECRHEARDTDQIPVHRHGASQCCDRLRRQACAEEDRAFCRSRPQARHNERRRWLPRQRRLRDGIRLRRRQNLPDTQNDRVSRPSRHLCRRRKMRREGQQVCARISRGLQEEPSL